MSARITHQDFTVCNLGGTEFITKARSFNFDPELIMAEGRAVNARYNAAVPVKRKVTFDITLMDDATTPACTPRISNLDVTIFSVGGSDYLGNLKDWTLTFNNATEDGSGQATFDEFPNQLTTGWELSGTLLMPFGGSAAHPILVASTTKANRCNLKVAVDLKADTFEIAGNMWLKGSPHMIESGAIQKYKVALIGTGAPSTCTGLSLLTKGLQSGQTGLVNLYAVTYAGNTYGTNPSPLVCAIQSGSVKIADASIMEATFGMQVQGGTGPYA